MFLDPGVTFPVGRGGGGAWFAVGIDEFWEVNPRDVGRKRGFAHPRQLLWALRHRSRAHPEGRPRAGSSWASPPQGRGLFPLSHPGAAASDKVGQAPGRARHRGSPGTGSGSRGRREDALEGSGAGGWQGGGALRGSRSGGGGDGRECSRGLCPRGVCCSSPLPPGMGGLGSRMSLAASCLPLGLPVVFGGAGTSLSPSSRGMAPLPRLCPKTATSPCNSNPCPALPVIRFLPFVWQLDKS